VEEEEKKKPMMTIYDLRVVHELHVKYYESLFGHQAQRPGPGMNDSLAWRS